MVAVMTEVPSISTVDLFSSNEEAGGSTVRAAPAEAAEPAPLLKEADPEFEKLLTEEEEIERQAQSRSKGPEHFRPNEGE